MTARRLAVGDGLATDIIQFKIGTGGAATIVLLTPLPDITKPLHIDGRTQTDYAGTNVITINAEALTAWAVTASATLVIRAITIASAGTGAIRATAGEDTLIDRVVGDWPSPWKGFGANLQSCKRCAVVDSSFKNRQVSVWIDGGEDATVTGNDFTGSGVCNSLEAAALRMDNVVAKVLPHGVAASGNTFGGTGCRLSVKGINNVVISGADIAGADIVLGTAASLRTGGTIVKVLDASGALITDLDVSRESGNTENKAGIQVKGVTNISMTRIKAVNRPLPILVDSASGTSTVMCSRFSKIEQPQQAQQAVRLDVGTLRVRWCSLDAALDVGIQGPATGAGINAQDNYWGAADGAETDNGSGATHSNQVDGSKFLTVAPACLP